MENIPLKSDDGVQNEALVDQQTMFAPQFLEQFKLPGEIPATHYQNKIELQGYTVFEILSDVAWSIAVIDLQEAPKHFHKLGQERFLVLNGELNIALDGVPHILKAGQSVHIPPGIVHHLKSNLETPVRVLCINFPAFDATDFYT